MLRIDDYALIADCHTGALVGRDGSVDWCCLPRFDSSSCFARLLDADRGGSWTLGATDETGRSRRYADDTMVLETTITTTDGEVVVRDCFTMHRGGRYNPRRQLLRVVDGVRGEVAMSSVLAPRFEYGAMRPWVLRHGGDGYAAIGASQGLWITGDVPWQGGRHEVTAEFTVRAGERRFLSVEFHRPETLDERAPSALPPDEHYSHLDETLEWWRRWAQRADEQERALGVPGIVRSAATLKALTYSVTGAMVAAPTTSLPESPHSGERNWDYRFAWIRDSAWSVRSLLTLGYAEVARGFDRFVERATAGSAEALQVLYGLGGEIWIPEIEIGTLAGFRGLGPVRVGNAAAAQLQLDAYGELLDLAWRWVALGHEPDASYWVLLHDLVEEACDRWREPDHGIWEVRGEERHFVHSKVMCWAAVDRGLRIAQRCGFDAPIEHWSAARREIRGAIDEHGIDRDRGCFVRAFGTTDVDAALLRLPMVGFVDWREERMLRTVDAVRRDLDANGLLLRYRADDAFASSEGAFVACTFWLAECLARQDRTDDAREVFDRAAATANEVGLFSEEVDPWTGGMLGNFPQALTHLSHLAAALALAGRSGEEPGRGEGSERR